MKSKSHIIHQSIKDNNLSAIETFIREGTDLNSEIIIPNSPDLNDYRSPLNISLEFRHLEIAKLIINSGVEVNRRSYPESPLALAVQIGNEEIIRLLLENGANVDDGGYYDSPLHHAVGDRNINLVKILINAGANANVRNDEGYTPLMSAARMGCLEIVKLLVNAGANVDLRDKAHSAVCYAAYSGNEGVFEYLYSLSTDLEYRDWVKDIVLPNRIKKASP